MLIEQILPFDFTAGPSLASVRTDAEGHFAFEGLGSGAYEVRARGRGGRVARVPVGIPAPGARVETFLRLPGGTETLRGRVVYADGRPFDGLLVVKPGGLGGDYSSHDPGDVVEPVDSDGRFSLSGFQAGGHRLLAYLPGRCQGHLGIVRLPQDEEARFTLALSSPVRGRVVDDETSQPVPNAQVLYGGSSYLGWAVTDGEGQFAIPAPRGEIMLWIEARDHAPVRRTLPEVPSEPVEIRLRRAGVGVGTVSERGTGARVPGTWVFALPHTGWRRQGKPTAALTNASGRFELRAVTPGRNSFVVFGSGWCSPGLVKGGDDASRSSIRDVPAGGTLSVDLEVVPSARLAGSVVSAVGDPVPGAVVRIHGSLPCGGDTGILQVLDEHVAQVVTDAEGRFTVATVLPGSDRRMSVQAAGHPPWWGTTGKWASGEIGRLDVRLAVPRWLDVTIRTGEGRGISNARVTVNLGKPFRYSVRRQWVCGPQGHVRIGPLEPGEIEITALASGHLEGTLKIGSRLSTESETAVLVLLPGHSLAGQVLLPEGVPPERVAVTVSTSRTETHDAIYEHPDVSPTGRWRVDDVPAGRYQVIVRIRWKGDSYEGRVEADTGDEAVEVAVDETRESPLRKLVVRVVDGAGRPVGSGKVCLDPQRLDPQRGWRSPGADLANGLVVFHLPEDHEGPSWIEVWGAPAERLGAALLGPLEELPEQVEVRLGSARTIEGRVLDPAGKPVSGAWVVADLIGPDGRTYHRHADTLTDDRGRYWLRGLGDLAYRVEAGYSRDFARTAAQDARAGTKDLVFRLVETFEVEVTVLDLDGDSVAGVSVGVRLQEETGSWKYVRTEADGVARLRGLTPGGRHILRVEPAFGSNRVGRTLEEWKPRDTTVRLEALPTIAGRVVDLQGAPIEGAYLRHRTASSASPESPADWEESYTKSDGRFEFAGLRDPTYELAVEAGHRFDAPSTWVRVAAGSTDVELRVDRGATLTVDVEGWPDGVTRWATLRVEEARESLLSHVSGTGSGRLRFPGLEAGRSYELRIEPQDDDLDCFVHVGGLRPSSEAVPLRTRTGEALEGRVLCEVPLSYGFVFARVGGGFGVDGRLGESGEFTLRRLPEGVFLVEATCRDHDGDWWAGAVRASAGDTIEIPLSRE